ncbi:hypothetical protein GCM10023066_32180 [Nocardioides kongjuensis]
MDPVHAVAEGLRRHGVVEEVAHPSIVPERGDSDDVAVLTPVGWR